MTEIEIEVKRKIFDDPIYCESREKSCDYCHGLWYCELFCEKLGEWRSLEIKCDQCKEAWKKAQYEKLYDEEKQYTHDMP